MHSGIWRHCGIRMHSSIWKLRSMWKLRSNCKLSNISDYSMRNRHTALTKISLSVQMRWDLHFENGSRSLVLVLHVFCYISKYRKYTGVLTHANTRQKIYQPFRSYILKSLREYIQDFKQATIRPFVLIVEPISYLMSFQFLLFRKCSALI